MKTKEQLGDSLCNYCTIERKGAYNNNGGSVAGCEGSDCDNAYDNYLSDSIVTNNEENARIDIITTDMFGEGLDYMRIDIESDNCQAWINLERHEVVKLRDKLNEWIDD